jgi:hypothetical protein
MKRFIGLLLSLAGGAAAVWGGFQVLTGQSETPIFVTDTLSITSLMAALLGVIVFTMGLIWVRD